jgi:hypothetical protein
MALPPYGLRVVFLLVRLLARFFGTAFFMESPFVRYPLRSQVRRRDSIVSVPCLRHQFQPCRRQRRETLRRPILHLEPSSRGTQDRFQALKKLSPPVAKSKDHSPVSMVAGYRASGAKGAETMANQQFVDASKPPAALPQIRVLLATTRSKARACITRILCSDGLRDGCRIDDYLTQLVTCDNACRFIVSGC